MMDDEKDTTHFGFQTVKKEEKEKRVAEVFQAVASKYDFMNNVMSFGLHHWWKYYTVAAGRVRPGQIVLDLAGGSGDLARLLSKKVSKGGLVCLADINQAMLREGRDKLLDEGLFENICYIQGNAESLPFLPNSFHCITMGFGLRNVTDKDKALRSMFQACKPGGQVLILEFSTPVLPGLKPIYDWYSFHILPKLGQFFAGDAASYQYLAESIRMHPGQEELKNRMEMAGFEDCHFQNFCGGIVALHIGYKY